MILSAGISARSEAFAVTVSLSQPLQRHAPLGETQRPRDAFPRHITAIHRRRRRGGGGGGYQKFRLVRLGQPCATAAIATSVSLPQPLPRHAPLGETQRRCVAIPRHIIAIHGGGGWGAYLTLRLVRLGQPCATATIAASVSLPQPLSKHAPLG